MPKNIAIHYGKYLRLFEVPTCHSCDKFVDELWECNTCGLKHCADCIIRQSEDNFECINCNKKRSGGI